ncbi:methyltransferase domain-containing protein [Streptomyces sp. NPDC003077]|uniref:SAM-dependent methyltransferase n=1 Tax=Streptomyces sp. NPDC003077 TaxID=3154443 RepID=UPI0033A2D810
MAATPHGANKSTSPTPEDVGAMYDRFGGLLAMTLGGSALHIGMFVPHGERAPVTSLPALADLAQDRQTDFLIDTVGLGPDGHLLDVGCGTGGPALRLARRSGGRVTGITVSRQQLAACEQRLRDEDGDSLADRVRFAYGNAMELAWPDASFDAAWSIDCFPHLSDRTAGFREVFRVLRPGGVFLMTDFGVRGTPDDAELGAFTELWACPPPTSFATLVTQSEEAGFRLTRVQEMTANMVLCSELMGALYQDRRAEIADRYGEETTAHGEHLMVGFRSFSRDHLEYYLLLLRKPEGPES